MQLVVDKTRCRQGLPADGSGPLRAFSVSVFAALGKLLLDDCVPEGQETTCRVHDFYTAEAAGLQSNRRSPTPPSR
jgi:hypothetical protein